MAPVRKLNCSSIRPESLQWHPDCLPSQLNYRTKVKQTVCSPKREEEIQGYKLNWQVNVSYWLHQSSLVVLIFSVIPTCLTTDRHLLTANCTTAQWHIHTREEHIIKNNRSDTNTQPHTQRLSVTASSQLSLTSSMWETKRRTHVCA